jgi:hypothetical protein
VSDFTNIHIKSYNKLNRLHICEILLNGKVSALNMLVIIKNNCVKIPINSNPPREGVGRRWNFLGK